MKKIVIALITLLPIVAYGDNMCVKDGSVLVVLDPQINGTALSNDATGKTWSTQFSYGIISGVGGCSTEGSSAQGAVSRNQGIITPYSTGTYCHCRMLRPVKSVWVFYKTFGQSSSAASNCATTCASNCSSSVATIVAMRTGMFSNIAE